VKYLLKELHVNICGIKFHMLPPYNLIINVFYPDIKWQTYFEADGY